MKIKEAKIREKKQNEERERYKDRGKEKEGEVTVARKANNIKQKLSTDEMQAASTHSHNQQ